MCDEAFLLRCRRQINRLQITETVFFLNINPLSERSQRAQTFICGCFLQESAGDKRST